MNVDYLKYYFTRDPMASRPRPRGDLPRLNIIIFSKNRACQVESLLRSIHDNLVYANKTITVLYRATEEAFAGGYGKTMARHREQNLNWVEETRFRRDLKEIVQAAHPEQLLMFMVDDDIVFRKFDLGFIASVFTPDHLFVSLRTSLSYRKDLPHPVFLHTDDFLEWEWKIQKRRSNTWNYPFSVDGNIYHAGRMQQVMAHISFAAPNSLESAMHNYRRARWVRRIRKAISPVEPVVVNNPLNRIQTEGETWNREIDPGYINENYLQGLIIDNSRYYDCRPTGTHQDLGLHFIPDPDGTAPGKSGSDEIIK